MATTVTPLQALVGSTLLYPMAFQLVLPSSPTPACLAQSREALSVIHCTLATALSLACLYEHRDALFSPATYSVGMAAPIPANLTIPDRDLPLITTRSDFGNAITAFETGYLLSDSMVLFYAARLARQNFTTSSQKLTGLNMRHLAYHHAGLSSALLLLQWYIYRRQEKGVLVIIMMMLMNASSPFGTLRWWLLNFRPNRKYGIVGATVAYLSVYAVARVGLVYMILRVWGTQRGVSALKAFAGLRWQCKLGTGSIAVVNTAWLIMGVSRFLRRSLRSQQGKKGQ